MASDSSKREIKIYHKTYRLPVLSGGNLDQLQKQIRQRNEHLSQGRLVVKKVEQRVLFSKKIVEEQVRQSLSFEERYQELNAIVQDYDSMVAMLKLHQSDYQRFFQDLAQEIREIITKNCQVIAEKEQKRAIKERQERDKPNPNSQSLALLANMKGQLFEITKSTGYAAVLMLKKLELMSKSLERIANDQETQRQFLASVLEEILSQKDLYELQLEINALQADTAKLVDIALNFDEYMKPFMGNFQTLLNNVAQVDQELSKAMGEINNIARLLESQQFGNLERDQESQRIAEFLITGELKKDRLQEALDSMDRVVSGAEFDANLLATGRDLSLEDCLANIREFVGDKLEKMKVITEVVEWPAEVDFSLSVTEDLKRIMLPGGVALELIKIPVGSFMMGTDKTEVKRLNQEYSTDWYNCELPQHRVTLQEFYLGKYPVTQEQYQAVMGNNPANFQDNPKNPVEQVSWQDAQAFCQKLKELTGQDFCLPTEAEWEYACRAGTQTRYYFGDDESQLGDYTWYGDNSGKNPLDSQKLWSDQPDGSKYLEKLQNNGCQTHPVGQKKPNAWGLYDMHGNVWEWCEDLWHESYAEKPENIKNNGSIIWSDSNKKYRVLRGGSWDINPRYCRSANRGRNNLDNRINFYGFRVACRFPS
jgi:formylglycine-generating enzyme required for sulfatase activity